MTSTNTKDGSSDQKGAIPLTGAEKKQLENQFKEIVNKMKEHGGLPDVGAMREAFWMASEAHGDTRRKTGEPYITHPLRVARDLAEAGHESDMVVAAILHDVVEDCDIPLKVIEDKFSNKIADIVDAVTKVNRQLAPYEDIEKHDLDELSDEKFLREIQSNQKAAYIKCADRIDNLRTISCFPEYKQKNKANHTRCIIIPVAKALHMHKVANTLGDLCLAIEAPNRYAQIKDTYQDILEKNKDTLYGEDGVIETVKRIFKSDSRHSGNVVDVLVEAWNVDGIYQLISPQMDHDNDVKEAFNKETVELFHFHIVVKDTCMQGAENVFFAFYNKLHGCEYRFTVIDRCENDYETYYILKDKFGNRYRVYLASQHDHAVFMYGRLLDQSLFPKEPDLKFEAKEKIKVFKKDGSEMWIAKGATVLDFAFAINPNVGLCAKYAHINRSASQTPIYTVLNMGDTVEIVSDHDKHNQDLDQVHATIRWFEYLKTPSAVKSLSRWLEKHLDIAVPNMLVYDHKGREYEVQMSSTVLDFAFAVSEETGLHLKEAYINGSETPASLDRTLRYHDKIRLVVDESKMAVPQFEWLNLVKTPYAKTRLIQYFRQQYHGE